MDLYTAAVLPTDGFFCAGTVGHRELNISPVQPPAGRLRHRFGDGPFAKLVMPRLPNQPGVYLWEVEGTVKYVGKTTGSLAKRLGSNGYATIGTYKTFARQPGRKNGGQHTNCRINSLANAALDEGQRIVIWYRVTPDHEAAAQEAKWMTTFGKQEWNRRMEQERSPEPGSASAAGRTGGPERSDAAR